MFIMAGWTLRPVVCKAHGISYRQNTRISLKTRGIVRLVSKAPCRRYDGILFVM